MSVLVFFPQGSMMAGDAHTRNLFAWLDKILEDKDLPPAAFKVAYFIAQSINRSSGLAWPSVRTIAVKIGFGTDSRGAVHRLLGALRLRGYLEIESGSGNRSNRYRMVFPYENKVFSYGNRVFPYENTHDSYENTHDSYENTHDSLASHESLNEPLNEPLQRDARARELELIRWEQQYFTGSRPSNDAGHDNGRRQRYLSPAEQSRRDNLAKVDAVCDRILAEIAQRRASDAEGEVHVPAIPKSPKPGR